MFKKYWPVLAVVGVFLIMNIPRGYRNNNPGNIKKGVNWDGLKQPQTDAVFAQFIEVEYGYRAMAKLLVNYQRIHGLSTVGGLINRYAPTVENETDKYAVFVADYIGVDVDDSIDVKANLLPLLKAISIFENGELRYSDNVIEKGIDMAGVA